MSPVPIPNRDQAALWNDASGRAWVDLQQVLDRTLTAVKQLILEVGFPGEGGRVLDLGCGAGATTLAMARSVGPQGACVGLDISAPLVAAAKARASTEGVPNATFIEGDAQTYPFEAGGFDAAISRFGVMFFDDPTAAFANVRRAVRPGGKLTFVAWRGPEENAFMTTAVRAAAPLLPDLPRPDPAAPGQFAFADGERVRRILEAAGWSSVDVARRDLPCALAAADLMSYITRMGPVGAALRSIDEPAKARVVAALQEAFQPFVKEGEARFDAACWLVAARA